MVREEKPDRYQECSLYRIMLVLQFSPVSGKIVGITEYLDTELAWKAKDAHGVY
jgi:hypothetical protein